MKESINNFRFTLLKQGVYLVAYVSERTGRSFGTRVFDMTLIDATKNSDKPKKRDLNRLKKLCKR